MNVSNLKKNGINAVSVVGSVARGIVIRKLSCTDHVEMSGIMNRFFLDNFLFDSGPLFSIARSRESCQL